MGLGSRLSSKFPVLARRDWSCRPDAGTRKPLSTDWSLMEGPFREYRWHFGLRCPTEGKCRAMYLAGAAFPSESRCLEVGDVTTEVKLELPSLPDAEFAQFGQACDGAGPSERLEESVLGGLKLGFVG